MKTDGCAIDELMNNVAITFYINIHGKDKIYLY